MTTKTLPWIVKTYITTWTSMGSLILLVNVVELTHLHGLIKLTRLLTLFVMKNVLYSLYYQKTTEPYSGQVKLGCWLARLEGTGLSMVRLRMLSPILTTKLR